jgi:hypothetical protein
VEYEPGCLKLLATGKMSITKNIYMKNHLSIEHKLLFGEMKKSLSVFGARESNFINVELLFYKAVAVAREYGQDVEENRLLAALKDLQANQYKQKCCLKQTYSGKE